MNMDVMMHLLEISDELIGRAKQSARQKYDNAAIGVKKTKYGLQHAIFDEKLWQRKENVPGIGYKSPNIKKLKLNRMVVDTINGPVFMPKPAPERVGLLRKYKNPLIAGGLAAGVGGALLYKRMKNKDK